ncbi:MAG: hypothetical protein ACO31C_00660 [Schleiferiaceae bacterium]|jgi:hypothetical protein
MVFPEQPQNRSAYRLIERADLAALTYAESDAVADEALRHERWRLLHKATFQGNVEERKVTLYFTADQGRFALHTTLWACTERTVVFKNAEEVPIRAVEAVEFHHSSEEE